MAEGRAVVIESDFDSDNSSLISGSEIKTRIERARKMAIRPKYFVSGMKKLDHEKKPSVERIDRVVEPKVGDRLK